MALRQSEKLVELLNNNKVGTSWGNISFLANGHGIYEGYTKETPDDLDADAAIIQAESNLATAIGRQAKVITGENIKLRWEIYGVITNYDIARRSVDLVFRQIEKGRYAEAISTGFTALSAATNVANSIFNNPVLDAGATIFDVTATGISYGIRTELYNKIVSATTDGIEATVNAHDKAVNATVNAFEKADSAYNQAVNAFEKAGSAYNQAKSNFQKQINDFKVDLNNFKNNLGKQWDGFTRAAEEIHNDMVNNASYGIEQGVEAAKELATKVKDFASELPDTVAQKVKDAADNFAQAAHEAHKAAQAAAEQAAKAVHDLFENLPNFA